MTANVDAMLAEGKRLFKAGKKDDARALFEKVTEIDQYNEDGWMWLSAAVDTYEDQRTCLENVLYINPNHQQAKQGLKMLEGKSGPVSGAKPAAPSKAAPDPTPEPEPEPKPRRDVPPTATSSASSVFLPEDEPTSEEYDSWVAGLNLQSQAVSTAPGKPFSTTEDLFEEDAFQNVIDSEFGFGDDEDDEAAALLGDFEDPFSANTDESEELMGGPFTADLDLDDLRAMVEDDMPIPTRPRSPASPTSSRQSARSAQSKPAAKSAALLDDDDILDPDDIDPGEYFNEIPSSIRATRLPGMSEKYPRLVIIGLIMLILANAGAAALLFTKLAG